MQKETENQGPTFGWGRANTSPRATAYLFTFYLLA
jgi:hypothetical protein